MSKTVEERIVSMEFNNSNFEKNVNQSMSTLEKLKQSLSFKGGTKGLENVSAAAKNVNFSSMQSGIDAVTSHFSALEVMGVTALANITNSAVNAGKRIVNALTLEPVMSGFQEYETQINAVQTILANTQSKGTNLEDVNAALDELNKYADMTIYNFTEMTRNIGTFTAAGVGLNESVSAIKGIANLAAVSGSTSQQASTAMYQLSQALATGRVALQDWNSVVNAGMGGELFQEALKRTARNMGIAVDEMIEKYGSFRESLTKGEWLTSEVLTETLAQLSGAYTEADLIQQGYTESQAKEITQLAQTATDAATKVKTFTQLWDTLKEAAQSGWTQTWEILIGDFEEAKDLLTGISDTVIGVINGFSDRRNNLLEGAFSSGWKQFSKEIRKTGIDMDDFKEKLIETGKQHGVVTDKMIEKAGGFEKSLKSGWASADIVSKTLESYAGGMKGMTQSTDEMNQKLEHFQKVVNEVWHGDYKNGQERVEALTKAGYDYATVQDLVNKTVDGHKLKIEDLSDAQAANLGFTEEQIKMLRQLSKEAKETGTPINDLIQKLSRPSGRELFIESLGNLLQPIGAILKSIGAAWDDAFPPNPEGLYNMISAFHSFTEHLVISEANVDRLTRTFKGVFAVIDMVTTVLGGGFKLGLTVVSKVLSTLWTTLGFANTGILEITATIGDAVVAVRDWFEEHSLINKAIEITVPLIVKLVEKLAEFVKELGKLPQVQNGIKKIKDVFKSLEETIDNITVDKVMNALGTLAGKIKDLFSNLNINIDFSEIAKFAIDGLANGLGSGVEKVFNAIAKVAQGIIDKAKEILGIHSPSRKMKEVGEWTIEGLVNGITEGIGKVFDAMCKIGNAIIDGIKQFDWSKAFSLLFTGGTFVVLFKALKLLESFSAPFEGAGKVLENFADLIDDIKAPIIKTIKSVSKAINAFAFKTTAEGVMEMAKAIAVMAGAVYLLSKLDSGALWKSIGAITALAGVLVLISAAMKLMNMGDIKGTFKLSTTLISLSAALLIMSQSVKVLGNMDQGEFTQGLIGLSTMLLGMVGIIQIFGTLKTDEAYKNVSKLGTLMLKMSVSLLLMVGVIKLISMLEPGELVKGGVAITAFIGIIYLLSKVTAVDKNFDKLGSTLLKMSISMGLMVVVIKMVSKLEPSEILKGTLAMTAFVGFMGIMAQIATIGKDQAIAKLGRTMLAMSTSMMLMVGVIKLISMLEPGEILKGMVGMVAFIGIIKLMTEIVKYDGQIMKVSGTILAMSVAIGIMAAVSIMLSFIDIGAMTKGIVAVGVLGTMMAMMIQATRGAQDVKGSIMAMAVAIAAISASVVALSFIDPGKLAGATAAIGILMGVFSGMLYVSKFASSSMGTIVTMVAAIGLMAVAIKMVGEIKGEGAIKAVVSISTLLIAMTTVMAILNNIKTVSPMALAALAVVTLVVGGIAFILNMLKDMKPDTAISVATSLSTLLLAMSAACLILAGVGATGPAAFVGIGALLTLVAGLGTFIAALGALTSKFPELETFLNKGIPILEKIGYALGSFFGNIIGGFSAGVTSGLPEIGKNLSDFMTNVQPFIDGAKGIDPSAMDGVQGLVKAIIGITTADLFSSITQWITGGDSMAEFTNNLIQFGMAMKAFSVVTAGIDTQTLMNASQSAQALVSAVNAIPKDGGFFSVFTGKINMEQFSQDLVKFGNAMKNYAATVTGIDTAAITNSVQASQGLIDVVNKLPKDGGFFQLFTGKTDFESISKGIVKFGKSLSQYGVSVAGLNVEGISTSVDATDGLVKMVNKLPKDGGFFSFFTGDIDIVGFGNNIVKYGKSLANFSASVAGIGAEGINTAVSATEKLVKAINSMKGIDTSGVGNFTRSLDTLAGANVKGMVSTFKNASGEMSSVGTSLVKNLASGIRGSNAASTAARKIASDAANAAKSQSSKFSSAGKSLGGKVATGIESKKSAVNSSTKSIVSGAASGLRSYYSSFYSAGSYVAQGFANGISAGTYAAAAKARAMARAAADAAKRQLDIHSPSRVFYKIGDFAGQGFVNALNDSVGSSYSSGKEMAKASMDGLSRALGGIGELTDDIDANPVIRPVVDLSNVEEGASAISGLLNDSNAVGIKAKAIGGIVNRRQNGTNNDVITAIKDLKKAVNSVGGTTYNVNGITYDDGSNVSSAVQSLIRAAKIERRV